MREAARNRAGFDLLRRLAAFGDLDEFRKIFRLAVHRIGNVLAARKARRAGREHAIFVGGVRFRRHDAVCREQDRAVKFLEFLRLFPPRIAIIADQMRIFFERRIIMRRQHFAVRIDINARPGGLFQQFFHIFQVVAADQNARIFAHADFHLRRLRMPVGFGIRGIEQRHDFDAVLPAFQHKRDELVGGQVVVGGGSQPLHDEIEDLWAGFAQHGGVFGIRGHAFEAVGQQFAQRAHVFVLRRQHAHFIAFCVKIGHVAAAPRRHFRQRGVNFSDVRLHAVAHVQRRVDLRLELRRIEIRVRDRHEQAFDHEFAEFIVNRDARFFARFAVNRNAFQHKNQQVLQIGDIGGFAAHAGLFVAAGVI